MGKFSLNCLRFSKFLASKKPKTPFSGAFGADKWVILGQNTPYLEVAPPYSRPDQIQLFYGVNDLRYRKHINTLNDYLTSMNELKNNCNTMILRSLKINCSDKSLISNNSEIRVSELVNFRS